MSKEKKVKDIGCFIRELPESDRAAAVETAVVVNPTNSPFALNLVKALTELGGALCDDPDEIVNRIVEPKHLSVLTTKYWGTKGVRLGVSFMDGASAALRDKIIAHMNRWHTKGRANVQFSWSESGGEIRISRAGGGYWSYLGTDVLQIPKNQQTMNLEGFTVNTPDAEFIRVVTHEAGHTLGFPHEHARRGIIAKLDPDKTIDYFRRFQGWNANTTRQQVLTPLEERSIMGTPLADETSIMTYQLPGSITRDGKPIPGGPDISLLDAEFVSKIYPLETAPPPSGAPGVTLRIDLENKVIYIPVGWTSAVTG